MNNEHLIQEKTTRIFKPAVFKQGLFINYSRMNRGEWGGGPAKPEKPRCGLISEVGETFIRVLHADGETLFIDLQELEDIESLVVSGPKYQIIAVGNEVKT